MDGAVNVDCEAWVDPDQIVDLTRFPWPWADDSVDGVCMIHVLEHLPDTVATICELYRIMKPGAEAMINVPHPRSDQFIGSPTHVSAITDETMLCFSQRHNRLLLEPGNPIANELLGLQHGVDFELVKNERTLTTHWWNKWTSGELTADELQFAMATYNNVIDEFRMVLRKV